MPINGGYQKEDSMDTILTRIIIIILFAITTFYHESKIRSLNGEIITIHSRLNEQSYDCVPIYGNAEPVDESGD